MLEDLDGTFSVDKVIRGCVMEGITSLTKDEREEG